MTGWSSYRGRSGLRVLALVAAMVVTAAALWLPTPGPEPARAGERVAAEPGGPTLGPTPLPSATAPPDPTATPTPDPDPATPTPTSAPVTSTGSAGGVARPP